MSNLDTTNGLTPTIGANGMTTFYPFVNTDNTIEYLNNRTKRKNTWEVFLMIAIMERGALLMKNILMRAALRTAYSTGKGKLTTKIGKYFRGLS